MDLNEVLHGLTYIGPDGYPMSRPQLMDVLAGFGMKDDKHRKMATDMLQMAGHLEYVLNPNGRGFYQLARPHLRPRIDGSMNLAGARSPDVLNELPGTLDPGTTWKDRSFEVRQPDIIRLTKQELKEADDEITHTLGLNPPVNQDTGWSLPLGDLPTWEAEIIRSGHIIETHPTQIHRDERCRIFDPDTLRWEPVSGFFSIFDYTGPLFLIRRPTRTIEEHVIVIKDVKGAFGECVLPPGLDHQRWARFMLLASYGREIIEWHRGDYLETPIGAQLPTGFTRALVDITGKVPSREGSKLRFHGVDEEIGRTIIGAFIESFMGTKMYITNRGGQS